jgi:hypothetical protein
VPVAPAARTEVRRPARRPVARPAPQPRLPARVEPRPYPPDLVRPQLVSLPLEPGFTEGVISMPGGVWVILGELTVVALVGAFAFVVVGRRFRL